MKIVGLKLFMQLDYCESLKDKRRIIQSILQKTRKKYGVSNAEVAELETINYTVLGFSLVSNSYQFARQILLKIFDDIEENYPVHITQHEWLETE